MSTATKPGKGRKLCGGCSNYVAAVTKVCSCGYDFKANKKPAEAKSQTYDKMGKGRKACPKCKAIIAASQHLCVCGHDFTEGKKLVTVKPVTTLPLAAQVATAMASAPVTPPKAVTPSAVTPKAVIPPVHRDTYIDGPMLKVFIPGGDCPVKLKGTSIEEVAAWADAVKSHYRERQMFLSTNGLIYFARKSWGENPGFDSTSAEFVLVKEHLIQLFGSGA